MIEGFTLPEGARPFAVAYTIPAEPYLSWGFTLRSDATDHERKMFNKMLEPRPIEPKTEKTI